MKMVHSSFKLALGTGFTALLVSYTSICGWAAEEGNRQIASEHNALEVAAPGRTPIRIFDQNGWKVNLSGFTELDVIADTTRSLLEVPGNSPIDKGYTYNGTNGRTQFSMRNSRFAFTVMPPEMEGVKSKAHLEFDLLGFEASPGGSNLVDSTGTAAQDKAGNKVPNTSSLSESNYFSSPTLRLRHAYLSTESNGWQFLAGQYWTLFGWKPFYFLTPIEVAPPAGMVFERTPQITLIKTLGEEDKLQMAVSIVRPPQRDAGLPRLDAGLRFSMNAFKAGNTSGPTGEIKTQPLSVGVSGTFRYFTAPKGDAVINSTDRTLGSALALNLNVPILPSSDGKDPGNTLTFQSEYTLGSGFAEQFPGWSGGVGQTVNPSFSGGHDAPNLDAGQGANTSSGIQLISLQSYNLQLQYHFPTSWRAFTNLGYGQIASKDVINFSGATYNRHEMAFVNLMKDFTTQIRIGAEYAIQQTYYLSGDRALNRRLQFSFFFIF